MINGKKVLAITLARGGSKRVPKKNIADINGKPLIQYTFDEVKKSKYIDRYVVSTDDIDIMGVCIENNVQSIIRPKSLAEDTTTSADALLHCVEEQGKYDYVVEIMCTNPLKVVEDIDSVIEKIDETNADSVVSVVRIWDHHPSRVKYIENGKLIDFYPEIPESDNDLYIALINYDHDLLNVAPTGSSSANGLYYMNHATEGRRPYIDYEADAAVVTDNSIFFGTNF